MTQRRTLLDLVLAVGFLAVATAIAVAHRSPPSGYEWSIYTGTPTLTWVALGLALAVAVGVTIGTRGWYQAGAIALGGLAVTSIVSLPVIRNYHFQGMGDSLTHLGWVRDFVQGTMQPHELFYPGLHAVATTLHLGGGVSMERALLIAVVLLFVPFVVFVPLIARDISGTGAAAGFAAIASWMVLPINNVATHMGPHTNSNALFVVPVALFATVALVSRRSDLERLPFGISPFTVCLFLAGVGLLLVHPQQMINVVVFLGALAGVQYLAKRRYDDHPMVHHPSLFAPAVMLGVLFVVWAAANARFRRAFSGLVSGLFSRDIGTGSTVGQRGGSLTELGGSLLELFAIMFLVAAVLGAIAALFVLATWLGRTSLDPDGRSYVTYFALALVPLGGMFVVYFLGTPTMAFRQVGFIYVVLTILSGIALAHLFGWLTGPLTTPGANALAAVFVAACLVLTLVTLFTSPLIYQPTQHVTEQQQFGYDTALEHRVDEQLYAGFGYGINRYGDAHYGTEAGSEINYDGGAGGAVLVEEFEDGNYREAYHGADYYFTVSAYDKARELEVYDELHHSEAALEEIEREPYADRLISSEEFTMYSVEGTPS
ncbi:DUF6541 family protein [Natronosalvus rutilus]|uniref:Uncharacterized protein n=1 Tax=Natronosalvus rutilus TaxID=2953753 RepID=A0A9E7NBE4_9EURY|nr:DUF6541 family protein [Natronosalvus rutilus]UTF55202.1 hypothetical protein NGM29_08125 [Natronosalvus rutilus]